MKRATIFSTIFVKKLNQISVFNRYKVYQLNDLSRSLCISAVMKISFNVNSQAKFYKFAHVLNQGRADRAPVSGSGWKFRKSRANFGLGLCILKNLT